jgi:uncharacterized protein
MKIVTAGYKLIDHQLIDKATIFVDDLFKKLPDTMYFHNASHTDVVFRAVNEIGKFSALGEREMNILGISALFHDVGYTQKYKKHEDAGICIATGFLQANRIDQSSIDRVSSCIAATRFPQKPKDRLGMIICDADLYHFSLADYPLFADNLRKELAENLGIYYTDKDWNLTNLNLLTQHRYFTDYARQVLEMGKQCNISLLRRLASSLTRSSNGMKPLHSSL